jgi:hypothetical protein
MLYEFNGVWRRTRFADGREYRDIFYHDAQIMTVDLPQYFADCGNPLPPKKDRRKVVFLFAGLGYRMAPAPAEVKRCRTVGRGRSPCRRRQAFRRLSLALLDRRQLHDFVVAHQP